jgi:hypothetical protein
MTIAKSARKIDEVAFVLIGDCRQKERAFQASSPKNFHGWSSDQPFFWLASPAYPPRLFPSSRFNDKDKQEWKPPGKPAPRASAAGVERPFCAPPVCTLSEKTLASAVGHSSCMAVMPRAAELAQGAILSHLTQPS